LLKTKSEKQLVFISSSVRETILVTKETAYTKNDSNNTEFIPTIYLIVKIIKQVKFIFLILVQESKRG